jgi:predicted NBD/HSP70 family sugar kinase
MIGIFYNFVLHLLFNTKTALLYITMTRSLITEIEQGHKPALIKRSIIKYYIYNKTSTIPELSKELGLSVPTVAKFINDMCMEGILIDHGKIDSHSGRRPCVYGLNPQSGCFLGVDIYSGYINIGVVNFTGEMIFERDKVPYQSEYGSADALLEICDIIEDSISESGISLDKIINACFNISGRVNPNSGCSYSGFNELDRPVAQMLSERFNMNVYIQNDTRSMTYGEYVRGENKVENNALFVNLSWGLGLGIIINGVVYSGKSGYAGEFGHVKAYDNEIMCHCGKKGCLETEVSGLAIHRKLIENLANGKNSILLDKYIADPTSITLEDIVYGIQNEDVLCIELIEQLGEQLGRQVAGLINIFNPEIVIVGGTLSSTEEYILQPIRQAVRKYSLNLVNRDSIIVCSKLGDKASVIGACLYARSLAFDFVSPN